jgi:hypothetical protein
VHCKCSTWETLSAATTYFPSYQVVVWQETDGTSNGLSIHIYIRRWKVIVACLCPGGRYTRRYFSTITNRIAIPMQVRPRSTHSAISSLWATTPEGSFKIGEWQTKKKSENWDRRGSDKKTQRINARCGAVLSWGSSGCSDAVCPCWQSLRQDRYVICCWPTILLWVPTTSQGVCKITVEDWWEIILWKNAPGVDRNHRYYLLFDTYSNSCILVVFLWTYPQGILIYTSYICTYRKRGHGAIQGAPYDDIPVYTVVLIGALVMAIR